ncbi:hydantoinase B/oxoprolinase family protein [Acrocarpospora catenulata]|uniref:hydantoinase B/oxoprolinase family protein n=1 Tax=Acrocarpospora catenulata TaxID=2836182 RepID=UPI001BDB569F|nr:hydantoinase B/oxoprolinase family protein [Acrocarpospora catenulata]
MAASSYDPVAVEINRRALEDITNEMATTLTKTSGSPVIYDVQDFATSLLDTDGEQLSLSATALFHSGSSLMGTRSIIEANGEDEVRPGDGWIVNDPYAGGAMHQADVAIITPLFAGGKHIAWAFSNVHVVDIGGSGISGFAPSAHSIFEETLRFPPTKIIQDGRIERGWERYIAANVRMPDLVLNDIRSMMAANNVSQMKLVKIIDEIGLERFTEYSSINKALSEKTLRDRIAHIPDGVYETADWVEFDGHGEELLLELNCRMTVDGTQLNFDFAGSPQVDASVNGTPGLVHGSLMATILTSLAYGDISFNSGLWRPITVGLDAAGSIVNATAPAPVSGGHTIVGTRVSKAAKDVLTQAFSLSDNARLRGRVAGQTWDATGASPLAGTGHGGQPTVVFFMDHVSGAGGGAQSEFDGMDLYGMTISPGVGLPSVEINESQQPALYLWRTLNKNSGGPGIHRGGLSMESAWAVYGSDGLGGAVTLGCAEVPARGAGGGAPGSAGTWSTVHGTNLDDLLADAQSPVAERLEGEYPFRPSHMGGLRLGSGDVLRMSSGGGGGLGDPLLRSADAIAHDLRNGYITAAHATAVYGVVLDAQGEIDCQRTTQARARIRSERLGAPPARVQERPEDIGISVTIDWSDAVPQWRCAYCTACLGPTDRNWREPAVSHEVPAADYYAVRGMFVRVRRDPPRIMVREHYCPECAGMLCVDVYPETFGGFPAPALRKTAGGTGG